MPDALAHVWAKSPSPNQKTGELLAKHTGALVGRLKGWRERLPHLATVVEYERIWDIAAWACLLHDIGKSAPGFQKMLRDGERFGHRHEVLSLVAVGWLELDERDLGMVAAGVGTHHKDWGQIWRDHRHPSSAEVMFLMNELSADAETAWRAWLAGEGAPNLERAGFSPLPALLPLSVPSSLGRALMSVDRLYREMRACQSASEPLARAVMAVRGLIHLADHAASGQERLGRAPTFDSVAAFLSAWGLRSRDALMCHQSRCSETDGHVLLNAPTGSGKTESALLWAARQREHLGPRATFYILPYRASLNAMRARIHERYGVSGNSIVLQHSAATTAIYQYLLERKDYGSDSAQRVAQHNRSLARLMTAPVRVLTPYQLLKAFFGLPGHEAVMTDAVGGLFILDEPHAYAPQRLGYILGAVGHLVRNLGGLMFATSATFPTFLRTLFSQIVPGGATVVEADAQTWEAFRRHRLRIADRDLVSDGTIEEIAARCGAGEAVLVVATTVARAQWLYDALQGRVESGGVSLLHSRFTGLDRARKESEVLDRIGTNSRLDRAGTILVATQVVEVSLDIDFDVLFTDPAPIEPLFQRFGRINRGRRGGERDVIVHTCIPDDSDKIYDRDIVLRSLKIMNRGRDRPIEESQVAAWVDEAYAPIEEQILKEVRDAARRFEQDVLGTNWPLDSHPELQDMFDDLFDGKEVVPAALEQEYARLLEHEPLLAPSLRVPISLRQFWRLRREGLIGPDNTVADVPYSQERGLTL